MDSLLQLEILPQPDDVTCGPTCLHAVYRYYGDKIPLEQVIEETPQLDEGGTLAALLGCHARRRGFRAKIYTFNLRIFDPTWFRPGGPDLAERLTLQMEVKPNPKFRFASWAYLEFLQAGGVVEMQDLTRALLRKYLGEGRPILAGLSSTWLYHNAREWGPKLDGDDIRGVPQGHFVVLCGYDREKKQVLVADPYLPNPLAPRQNYYTVGVDRVINAILLGVLTYDANLLILEPESSKPAPAAEGSTKLTHKD